MIEVERMRNSFDDAAQDGFGRAFLIALAIVATFTVGAITATVAVVTLYAAFEVGWGAVPCAALVASHVALVASPLFSLILLSTSPRRAVGATLILALFTVAIVAFAICIVAGALFVVFAVPSAATAITQPAPPPLTNLPTARVHLRKRSS